MIYDIVAVGASLIDLVALVEAFPSSDDEVYVPKLRIEFGGSAANTAVALARLGLKTAFLGKVGADFFGESIINKFREEKVDTTLITRSKTIPTGICFIVVDPRGDRRMFAFSGAANDLSLEEFPVDKIMGKCKILYLASLENIAFLSRLSEAARKSRLKVALNPGALIANQGLDKAYPVIMNTDIYISSMNEAHRLFGTENLEELRNKILSIGPSTIAITLGSKGCFVADKSSSYNIPPIKVKVKDTTGAGDAFTAGFLAATISGKPLAEAGYTGSAAAAFKIREIGARNGLPTIKQLDEFIHSLRGNLAR